MQNQKVERAHQVLGRIARMHNKPPLDENLVREIANREMGGENVDANGRTIRSSYWTILSDRELRARAFCLMTMWFSWSLVTFGLAFNIKNIPGNPYLNVIYMGVTDAVGYPATLLIINRLGRKVSVVITMSMGSACLVALAAIYLTVDVKEYPKLVLIMYLSGKFGIAIARSALRCLTAESFPTPVRSMGMHSKLEFVACAHSSLTRYSNRYRPLWDFNVHCSHPLSTICLPGNKQVNFNTNRKVSRL